MSKSGAGSNGFSNFDVRATKNTLGDTYLSVGEDVISEDSIEVLLGISEGPIKGLVDGGKTFFLGDTTLIRNDGSNEPNFKEFELIHAIGSEIPETIRSRLGGFASPTSVNATILKNVPVVRTMTTRNIDFIDCRIVFQRLYHQGDEETDPATATFKIEYKLESDEDWTLIDNLIGNVSSTDGQDVYYAVNYVNQGRRAFVQGTQPTSLTEIVAVWFDTSDGYKPHLYSNSEWYLAPNLSHITSNGGNLPYWEWFEPFTAKNGRPYHVFYGDAADEAKVLWQGRAPGAGDYWIVTDESELKYWTGTKWVQANDGTQLEEPSDHENPAGTGIITVNAELTSPFVYQSRFPVPSVDENILVRVTKLTNDSDDPEAEDAKYFGDLTWESFAGVVAYTFSWPFLATTQLNGKATGQFTSIPEFAGIYYGRIIRVPSNYDEEERTYDGVWDGTWKLAYTNNPAYVTLDLVENTRYGMSAFYPISMNKWDVYDAGVFCDVRAEDGTPRFTFNNLIQDARLAREQIDYVCGIFGGRFVDDGNGFARILIDNDRPAVDLFTKENVVDGIFSYSLTDPSTRFNDVHVTFINKQQNWTEDTRTITDQVAIDDYGRTPHEFVAVGCIIAEEADRRGRYKLVTSQTEKIMVTFKASRQGYYVQPYDIILIADDQVARGSLQIDPETGIYYSALDIGGVPYNDIYGEVVLAMNEELTEVLAVDDSNTELLVQETTLATGRTGRTLLNPSSSLEELNAGYNIRRPPDSEITVTDEFTIVFRDPVYFEGGITYKIVLQGFDDIIERTLEPTSGLVYSISTTEEIPELPERTVFAIYVDNAPSMPKAFRAMSISGDDPDFVEITAVEVNRTKWEYIDGHTDSY